MILMLRKSGSINAEYDVQVAQNELAKFNSQFEIYDKQDNTIFDIITVANHAYDVNAKNGYDLQNSVTVEVKFYEGIYTIIPDSSLAKNYFMYGEEQMYIYDEEFIKRYSANDQVDGEVQYHYLFKCTEITYNNITGKVDKMIFEVVATPAHYSIPS